MSKSYTTLPAAYAQDNSKHSKFQELNKPSDSITNSKVSFIKRLLEEPYRKVLTHSQLKKILLREKVKAPEWYAKKDMTGRVKLI